MSEIVSKELLSEVFTSNQQEFKIDSVKNNIVKYSWLCEEQFGYGGVNCKWVSFEINIYELAHKCKEWAYEQGYLIGLNCRQGVILIDRNTHMTLRYISIDGLDQVVKFELNLCQWLLENKDKR